MGDKRRYGSNDSQCYTGNYLLISASAEDVMIASLDLKKYVDSGCVSYQSGVVDVL